MDSIRDNFSFLGTGYRHCKLEFMNVENIHVIRKSCSSLQTVVEERFDDPLWNTLVDASGWMTHVRILLSASARVADVMDHEGASALVRCSDGWDRTSQMVSLAQIMLSPYYRTMEGFQLLIEKDWIAFGHKFHQRHGHLDRSFDDSQRAPIFLQYLDAVWQLTAQFPCSFEFNESFLIEIAEEAYACVYGTFLLNSEMERKEAELRRRTVSLWTDMNQKKEMYRNVFYFPDTHTMIPNVTCDSILLWKSFFLRFRVTPMCGMTKELRFLQMESALNAKEKQIAELLRQMEEMKQKSDDVTAVVFNCDDGDGEEDKGKGEE